MNKKDQETNSINSKKLQIEPVSTYQKDQVWQEVKELVIEYEKQLKRFEPLLFNIQKHPKLSTTQRPHIKTIYEELKKHLHNLSVLKEEFQSNEILEDAEKNVVFEASEQILTQSYNFISNLKENLSQK